MLWILVPLLIVVALGLFVRRAAEKVREEDARRDAEDRERPK